VKFEYKYTRISNVSDKAKKDIEKALSFKTKKYAYLDLEF